MLLACIISIWSFKTGDEIFDLDAFFGFSTHSVCGLTFIELTFRWTVAACMTVNLAWRCGTLLSKRESQKHWQFVVIISFLSNSKVTINQAVIGAHNNKSCFGYDDNR